MESPAELVIDEREPENPAHVRTPAVPVCSPHSPMTFPTQGTAKEPVYNACYFNSLENLHAHESQNHRLMNDSQIACPWCGHRLSCYKRRDLHCTLKHLRTHLRRHQSVLFLSDLACFVFLRLCMGVKYKLAVFVTR